MGLDVECKSFHDMRVMKADYEIGEAVEVNRSTTKIGFNGS